MRNEQKTLKFWCRVLSWVYAPESLRGVSSPQSWIAYDWGQMWPKPNTNHKLTTVCIFARLFVFVWLLVWFSSISVVLYMLLGVNFIDDIMSQYHKAGHAHKVCYIPDHRGPRVQHSLQASVGTTLVHTYPHTDTCILWREKHTHVCISYAQSRNHN